MSPILAICKLLKALPTARREEVMVKVMERLERSERRKQLFKVGDRVELKPSWARHAFPNLVGVEGRVTWVKEWNDGLGGQSLKVRFSGRTFADTWSAQYFLLKQKAVQVS